MTERLHRTVLFALNRTLYANPAAVTFLAALGLVTAALIIVVLG